MSRPFLGKFPSEITSHVFNMLYVHARPPSLKIWHSQEAIFGFASTLQNMTIQFTRNCVVIFQEHLRMYDAYFQARFVFWSDICKWETTAKASRRSRPFKMLTFALEIFWTLLFHKIWKLCLSVCIALLFYVKLYAWCCQLHLSTCQFIWLWSVKILSNVNVHWVACLQAMYMCYWSLHYWVRGTFKNCWI